MVQWPDRKKRVRFDVSRNTVHWLPPVDRRNYEWSEDELEQMERDKPKLMTRPTDGKNDLSEYTNNNYKQIEQTSDEDDLFGYYSPHEPNNIDQSNEYGDFLASDSNYTTPCINDNTIPFDDESSDLVADLTDATVIDMSIYGQDVMEMAIQKATLEIKAEEDVTKQEKQKKTRCGSKVFEQTDAYYNTSYTPEIAKKLSDEAVEAMIRMKNKTNVQKEPTLEKLPVDTPVETDTQVEFVEPKADKNTPSILDIRKTEETNNKGEKPILLTDQNKKKAERIVGIIDLFRGDIIEFMDEPTMIQFDPIVDRITDPLKAEVELPPDNEQVLTERSADDLRGEVIKEGGTSLLRKTLKTTKNKVAKATSKIAGELGKVKKLVSKKVGINRNEHEPVMHSFLKFKADVLNSSSEAEANCFKFNDNPFIKSDRLVRQNKNR